MEKSRFLVVGPRPARRARVPNWVMGVPFAFTMAVGTEKAAGLKNPSGPGLGKYIETPGTPFGTLKVAKIFEGIRLVRMSVGKPFSTEAIPFNCQPPRRARATPG